MFTSWTDKSYPIIPNNPCEKVYVAIKAVICQEPIRIVPTQQQQQQQRSP